MSHAKKGKCRYALCSHISISGFVLFHRAKPVTEMERSGIEVHGGLTGGNEYTWLPTPTPHNTNPISKAGGTSPYKKSPHLPFLRKKMEEMTNGRKESQQKKVLV